MNVINSERYWQLLMDLAKITEPDMPYTRRAFSPMFLQGREWLTEQFRKAGLETSVDTAGNLVGRLKGNGSKKGVITIGSHSDTVPRGGRFDGIAGVIAGLECVLSWKERGIVLNHDVDIIDYLAEEPSDWGMSCIGSRGITGFMTEDLLQRTHLVTGERLDDAIRRVGGNPSALVKRDDVAASFEMHIEQGRVLEHEQLSIGVVSGIVGIIRLEVVLQGQSNHAGTTPMHIRHDANTAAAELILAAESLAQQKAQNTEGYFVATCGQVFPKPNASNVIAGQCRIVFDVRSDRREWMDDFVDELHQKASDMMNRRGVQITQWEKLTDTIPVSSDKTLMKYVSEAAEHFGASYRVMPSGAGHDSAFMAHIAPMVMVFVPSKNGLSHNPDEWTEPQELALGVDVLCQAVEQFDRRD